jgi:hypothetical protein
MSSTLLSYFNSCSGYYYFNSLVIFSKSPDLIIKSPSAVITNSKSPNLYKVIREKLGTPGVLLSNSDLILLDFFYGVYKFYLTSTLDLIQKTYHILLSPQMGPRMLP